MRRSLFHILLVCGFVAAALPIAGMQRQGGGGPAAPPPQTNTDLDISSTWFQLPAGMEFGGSVSVGTDGKGHILYSRRKADPPVVIFDRSGKYVGGFGTGVFSEDSAHSIDVDGEGFAWATDRNAHVVYKFSMDGKLLLTLGKKGVEGDNTSTDLFNRPSDVAVAANGDIFVTDGYGNSRIVKFSRDGKFLKIIGGEKGKAPGQFDVPHAIAINSKGQLVVTDRANGRIQIFDQEGKFIEQWTNLGIAQPSGLHIDADDTVWTNDNASDLVIRVKDGKVIETIRGLGGRPHMIAVDQGVLYETGGPVNELKRIRKKS